jgi:hypothetical protein
VIDGGKGSTVRQEKIHNFHVPPCVAASKAVCPWSNPAMFGSAPVLQ